MSIKSYIDYVIKARCARYQNITNQTTLHIDIYSYQIPGSDDVYVFVSVDIKCPAESMR